MMYFIVDGLFSGTGIRNLEGAYIEPKSLGISDDLSVKITNWLKLYEDEHYFDYENKSKVEQLDKEGIDICRMLKKELPDIKVEYYSNAKLMRIPITLE